MWRIITVTGLLTALGLCPIGAASAPAQRELKTYALHDAPSSAEVSPDERFVVTLVAQTEPADDPSKVKTKDAVQLWDFRSDKLIAEASLRTRTTAKQEAQRQTGYVRFSGDGQLVVAYLDHCLYILRAEDLQEVRRIPLTGPPDVTRSFTTKSGAHTVTDKASVAAFELSPLAHLAAAVWARGYSDAWIDVIDFDSAKESVWNTQDRGVGWTIPKAIAWLGDGQQLIVAVQNGWACGAAGNNPDVFAVEPLSGTIKTKFTTGFLVGDIAVTRDGRVLAVDCDCVGVFRNHDPKLRVFDLRAGKRMTELSGRGGGVRYGVSTSRYGDRAVANTGIVKAGFDWGDMVPHDVHVDTTFSVWNLANYEGLVTSQNLQHTTPQRVRMAGHIPLRMSSKGTYVLFRDAIYEIP